MAGKDHSAYFVTVIAVAWPDGKVKIFDGRLHGTLTFPPRGTDGFGYMPIFQVPNDTRALAEMTEAERLKSTLENLSRQTSLQFTLEPRQLDVWYVTESVDHR